MKFIENVETERYRQFASACPINHYVKMPEYVEAMKPGFFAYDLLGVEDDEGNLIGTALMVHRRNTKPSLQYSYIPRGFNINDLENRELIRFFAKNLGEFAKKKGSVFLRMDPDIARVEHEKNGRIKEGGFDHEYIREIFEECGYDHLGYPYGYGVTWLHRYTMQLNLDRPWKEIKKGIKRCSQYQSKNELRAVKVRPGTRDELHILADSQDQLSHKLGFKPRTAAYWEKFYDTYGDAVHYYIVTINYHEAILNMQKKIDEDEAHLKVMKDENKMEPIRKNIEAMRKEIEEIKALNLDVDEDIPYGAKFIIMVGNHVWNMNMYTKKTSMYNFRCAFALHMYALEELYKAGAKLYDFEGISGSLDPKDPYYGMFDFKRSFGGDFIEYLGEFDYVCSRSRYNLWKASSKMKSSLRHTVNYIFNHRNPDTSAEN